MESEAKRTTSRDLAHEMFDYAKYQGRRWQWYEPLYLQMRPTPPVLDVGSGLGLFVECCLHNGLAAVGVELSEEGIAASAARRLPVVRADLGIAFPFRDESFGSVLAHHVLEHVARERERTILKEVHRILRPGGFLLVVSPNVHHPQAHDDPDHVNLFTPHQLRSELRAAGFSRVSLSTNFWRPLWEPHLHLGRMGTLLSGALWKVLPVDRFAASASALAWK